VSQTIKSYDVSVSISNPDSIFFNLDATKVNSEEAAIKEAEELFWTNPKKYLNGALKFEVWGNKQC